MPTERTARVSAADLHAFCTAALTKVGVADADARTTADVLVTTDTWGVFTHGVKVLRGYVRRLQAGGLRADARPEVVAAGPAWAVVDGHSALGMVTSVFAMRAAMAKARRVRRRLRRRAQQLPFRCRRLLRQPWPPPRT